MALNILSERSVEREKRAGRHHDGGGLYLKVLPTGGKSWAFVATWAREGEASKRNQMGLGSFPAVGLVEARELAAHARRLIAGGQDPMAERGGVRTMKARADARAANALITFGDYATEVAPLIGPKKDRGQLLFIRSMTKEVGALAKIPLQEVTDDDVYDALVPYAHDTVIDGKPRKARTAGANRMLLRIEKVMAMARANKKIVGPWSNPADRQVMKLRLMLKPHVSKRYVMLPFEECPAFLVKLRALPTTAARLGLEFTILTCVRTSEARLTDWSEIDLDKKLWTIPADRMKGKEEYRREHTVPLSDAALAVLKQCLPVDGLKPASGLVFEQALRARTAWKGQLKPISHSAMLKVLPMILGEDARVTVHGFRSAFRTWAQEVRVDHDIAEMCLAHAVGNEVSKRYARSDLLAARKTTMADWATFLGKVVGENVTPLAEAS